jgi:hypothetical protein
MLSFIFWGSTEDGTETLCLLDKGRNTELRPQPILHAYLFMMRTFKIYSFSNFHVQYTLLLTILNALILFI